MVDDRSVFHRESHIKSPFVTKRNEVDFSLVGLGFLPIPEQIMLRQHLVREAKNDNRSPRHYLAVGPEDDV